jgi:hypothetical protein
LRAQRLTTRHPAYERWGRPGQLVELGPPQVGVLLLPTALLFGGILAG